MYARDIPEFEQVGSAPRPGWLGRAITSGFVATVIMLFFFLVAYSIARVASTVPLADRRGAEQLRLWLHNLTTNQLIDAALSNVYIAIAVYLAGGIAWAVLYAAFLEPRLPGPGWAKGILFSLLPGLLSIVGFLPLVGGGMFGTALGAGPLPVLGNLLLHVLYGATLGVLYGPFGDVDAARLPEQASGVDVASVLSSERMTAGGLVLGVLLGGAAGVVLAVAASAQPDQRLLGEPIAALILATAILGATLGGLVGSIVGLSAPGGQH
jgi:hypothetical protein